MSLYKSHNARKPAKFRLSVENRCPSIGHQKKTFACLPHYARVKDTFGIKFFANCALQMRQRWIGV